MSVGITETKEAMIAVDEIALFIAKRLKDGVGFDDVVALFEEVTTDEEFKAVLKKGYDGIKNVPAEIKAIDVAEVTELIVTEAAYVPKFIAAISG
jgi:hypothetical protein